jgi:LexA DNA binding domain
MTSAYACTVAGVGDWQRRRILRFVQEFGRREGHSPSYREIAEELGLAVSTAGFPDSADQHCS